MKSLIRSVLDAVFSSAPEVRTKLTHYLMTEKLATALRRLQSEGIAIDVVYDIGARHGDWTASIRKTLPKAQFFLFEANQRCAAQLASTGFEFAIGVLSSDARVVQFYDGDGTGDSYYKESSPRYESVVATERTTRTLDSVLQEHSWPHADFIKLDTQGSELDVLRGGLSALRAASLLYLECPTVRYNSGAPTFQEYIDFLDEHGFIPVELCELHYGHGVLLQVDVLFVKKEHLRKMSASSASVPTFLR